MQRKFLTISTTVFLVAFFASTPLLADKHVVEEIKLISSASGEGAELEQSTSTVETWIGKDRYARVDGLNKTTTIVRRDLKKMYIVQHEFRQVIEIELPFTLPDYLRPLFAEVRMDWQLNRLTEKKRINNWNCTRVMLRGRGVLSIDVEMWVSPETGIDTRAFSSMVSKSLAATPMYHDLGAQMASLSPNFSIRTVTTVSQMGLSATTESTVSSITDEQAPGGIYDPPAGYKIEPLNFSTYLSMVRYRQPSHLATR